MIGDSPYDYKEIEKEMMYDDDDIWVEGGATVAGSDTPNLQTKRWPGSKQATEDARKSALGAKYDSGKLLWGCLTRGLAFPLRGVVAVLTYGAQKYAADSWQQVPNAKERYSDALDRHWNAFQSGEQFDPESGLHHMLHVACNALFITWFVMQAAGSENDFTKFNKVEKK